MHWRPFSGLLHSSSFAACAMAAEPPERRQATCICTIRGWVCLRVDPLSRRETQTRSNTMPWGLHMRKTRVWLQAGAGARGRRAVAAV